MSVDRVADVGVGGRELDLDRLYVIKARAGDEAMDLFGVAEAADTLASVAGVVAERIRPCPIAAARAR